MKSKKYILIVVVLLLVVAGGYVFIKWKKSDTSLAESLLPKLEVMHVQLTHMTDKKMEMIMTLVLDNPAPVGFALDSIAYTLYVENQEVTRSTHTHGIDVDAGDTSHVSFPVTLYQDKLKALLEGLENQGKDSVEYKMKAIVYNSVLPNNKLEIEKKKQAPLVHIPEVEMKGLRLKRNPKGITLELKAQMKNENVFGFGFDNIKYSVKLENHKAIEGTLSTPIKVKAHDSTSFVFPVELNLKELGYTIQDYIKKGSSMTYDLKMKMDLVSEEKMVNNSRVAMVAKGTVKEMKEAMK